jgi:hypothetical protein
LRQEFLFIFKYGQSIIPGRDLEKSLVFQSELKKKVSRSKPKDHGREAHSRGKDTSGPENRHQREPANRGTNEG